MNLFLIIIPLLTMISALFMYRFTGRREIMKFDLVQFVYAFVISPVMFVWLKFFLFFLLKNELNLKLSINNLFVFDTILTLIFLYMYAFVVIHTLTKTFDLYRDRDPLYDVFEHTEFFHMWVSHFAIYLGAMSVLSFIGIVNLFVPAAVEAPKQVLYILMGAGGLTGIGGIISIWLYESPDPKFHKLMKLSFGLAFLVHALLYFLLDPRFSIEYSGYWYVFSIFFVATFLSLFAEKTEERRVFGLLPFILNWRKPTYYVAYFSKTIHKVLRQR